MDEMVWKMVEKGNSSDIQSSLFPVRVPSAPPLTPLISVLCWLTQTCLIIYALHSCVAASPSSSGQIAFACIFTIPSISSISGQHWTPGLSSLDSAGLDYNPKLVIFKDYKISCFISASLTSGLQVQLNFLVHRRRRLWWCCELLPEQSKNKHEKNACSRVRVSQCCSFSFQERQVYSVVQLNWKSHGPSTILTDYKGAACWTCVFSVTCFNSAVFSELISWNFDKRPMMGERQHQ